MPILISPLNVVDCSGGIWDHFIDRARRTPFLLLGEMHGAIENPRILITLLSRLHAQIGLRFLGVEWEAEYQEAIDRYTLLGQTDPESVIPCTEDGRVSLEHHQLLDWLADFNRPLEREAQIHVICFAGVPGEGSHSWNARDRGMYEQFMKEYRIRSQSHHSPALLTAGNLHTRTAPFISRIPLFAMQEDREEEYVPFGAYFARDTSVPQKPLRLNLKYASGAIHNMHVKEIGAELGNPERLPLFNGRFADAECLLVKAEAEGDFDFVIRQAHPVTMDT